MSDRILTILAGGSSRRFQNNEGRWSDKVLKEYNNKPLLVHLLEGCRRYYDLVGISVNTKARKRTYSKIVNSYITNKFVKYIIDFKKVAFEGVLKGIYSTMEYFENKSIQFIPSDRPYLLFEILKELKVKPNGVSIFKYSDGMIEPLLALYGSNSRISSKFLNLSLSRADVPIRLSQYIQTYCIDDLLKKNDLSADIFTNINVQGNLTREITELDDLSNICIPSPENIEKQSELILNDINDYEDVLDVANELMEKEHFYAAYLLSLSSLKKKKLDSEVFKQIGKEALLKEREYWKVKNLPFLELHALQDLITIFPEEQTRDNMSSVIKLKEKMKIKSRRLK